MLVMDWGNHRGMIFDRENKFVRAFGSQLFIRPTYADKQEKTPEPAAPTAPPPAGRACRCSTDRPWHAGRSAITHDGNFWCSGSRRLTRSWSGRRSPWRPG
ncbi:MAG: hypothetical protein IPK67_14405 [Planctomycetes bacterium]|nr:hypothetical protein [Planctomycetota bacterium]